jgi:hypothetical protein
MRNIICIQDLHFPLITIIGYENSLFSIFLCEVYIETLDGVQYTLFFFSIFKTLYHDRKQNK